MPSRQLNSRQLQKRRENDKKLFLTALIIEIVILIFSISIMVTLNRYEILPFKYRGLITGILIVVNVYFAIILVKGINRRALRKVGLLLGVLTLVLSVGISIYLNKAVATLNKVSIVAEKPVEIKKVVMSVRVMKNSPILALEDLEGKTIDAPVSTDSTNLNEFYAEFKKENDVNIEVKDVVSYLQAVEELYDGMAQAIILNEDHMSIIKEKFPNFDEETRAVTVGSIEYEDAVKIKKVDTANESFNILISGIDTFGSIEASSRSDVNIVVTVNPKTKTILMTSIPRDTYMRIPGNGMNEWDKLTHAGIYGIQTSVDAVENFLDIGINYYIKVNFSSVITLVDLIGGVEIDNPYEFLTYDFRILFPPGVQTLDGEQALAYVRERYNLPGGDNDRGANQERVLTAIFNKIIGPEILTNFSSLLEIAQSSMQTSMSTNEMMKLVNLQLSSGTPWEIVASSVQGDGQYGWSSYAAPGYNVYVQIPYEDSIAEAKQKINEVMRGTVAAAETSASTQ